MTENSTISIEKKYTQILAKLASANGVSKKDFIAYSLDYFEKYGINPIEHESPSQEMKKLIKRVDQIIGFIRQQEKDILKPSFEAITTSEIRIQSVLNSLAKDELITKLISDLQEYFGKSSQVNTKQTESLKQALILLAQAIEERNPSGLTDRIKNIFNR